MCMVSFSNKNNHSSRSTATTTTTAHPATMEWIDVAGLAPNAHRGEGLGNQFLGTLRTCHALCHVVRVFDDITTTTNVDSRVLPGPLT